MLQKLNLLIGNKYNYKGNVIVINEVKIVSTTYVVKTDKRTYNFFESEIDDFISNLIDYVEKPINIPSEKSTDLSEILYDTIDKVKKDKSYIGQANAICNIVSQMINIKKLEIQLKNK
jgi:hypothetical protein